MGSLNLPTSGLVYADSDALIYSVEKDAVFAPLLRPLWQAAQWGQIEVVSSELALLETLVGPLKEGDSELTAHYEEMFRQDGLRLLPITQPILREGARLRASIQPLRTPDAIHAATAMLSGVALFLSNDEGFRRVPGLPLAILKDVLSS